MRRALYSSLQKQRRTVKQPVKRPKDEEEPPRRASPKFGGRAMFYVQSRSLQQSPLPTELACHPAYIFKITLVL